MLVSWTRLVSGEWRDPLVARDVLIGCAFGVLGGCISIYGLHLPLRFLAGLDLPVPLVVAENLNGPLFVISNWLSEIRNELLVSLATLCVLVILQRLLRNQKVAIAVCIIFITLAAGPTYGFESVLIYGVIWFFVLMRFGFIAAISVQTIASIFIFMPLTLDTHAWYSTYGYLTLAIFAAIVLYAFRTSLGGRPMFGTPRLDD
jgi:serine/threonine-protein kinase